MSWVLSPADQVRLDQRIVEERMLALDPPFQQPDWFYDVLGASFMPVAVLMNGAGSVNGQRTYVDEVVWSDVAALRLETPDGVRLDPEDFDDGDDMYGEAG